MLPANKIETLPVAPPAAWLAFSDTKEITEVSIAPLRWIWHFYTLRLTQAGRWLLWPTVGYFAFTSASFQYQSFVPLSYFIVFWVVAAFVAVIRRPAVRAEVRHATRVWAGEFLPVEVSIEQTGKGIGLDLFVVPHCLPFAVDDRSVRTGAGGAAALPALTQGQKVNAKLALYCGKRGNFQLKGFRVETDFPFGIMRSYEVIKHEKTLLVYPRFSSLAHMQLPAGRRYQPGGVALATELGDSVEFIGNRDYREGDNLRDVDWRATARLNRPIVREYRQEYFLRVAVVLDTHVPFGKGHKGKLRAADRRQDFERAVSICAAIGEYLARKEYIVDIFAAGPNLYHLVAGRSLAYLEQILDILACVGENPVEPFGSIEPELMENLSRISTVICVFLEWNETRRKFVHNLQQQGVGLKTIVLSDAPSPDEYDAGGEDVRFLSRADFETGIGEL